MSYHGWKGWLREAPIKPKKILQDFGGQRLFIYSSIHSEIFPQHLGGGWNFSKQCEWHRDEWSTVPGHTLLESTTHTGGYLSKVIVRNLTPPFPGFIPFLGNGIRGWAATDGSVWGQRTTHWITEQGRPEKTVLSSTIGLGTALATSVSPEKKISHVNNWPVIPWERFHPWVNTFYSRYFESLSWWQENVDIAAVWGLAAAAATKSL